MVPAAISISSFGLYLGLGNELTPSITYTVVMMFGMMRGPLFALPWLITFFMETVVSIKRIEDYLLQDDVNTEMISKMPDDPFAFAL